MPLLDCAAGMWVLLSCSCCAEWLSGALWASAFVPIAFSHWCHSLSLCIVNGVCRCTLLVLPVSVFCWCPLIICLLMEMTFISTAANRLILERPTCLLISHSIFITGAISLICNWGDRLLMHLRHSMKSGADGWGAALGQVCDREKRVIGCCLLDMRKVSRWCLGRLICSISFGCQHLFTLIACVIGGKPTYAVALSVCWRSQ